MNYVISDYVISIVDCIVYSLIPGPQTFSGLFYTMKVCEETVLCNQCAVHLLSENVFGLKIWGAEQKFLAWKKKMSLEGFFHFFIWNRRMACRC